MEKKSVYVIAGSHAADSTFGAGLVQNHLLEIFAKATQASRLFIDGHGESEINLLRTAIAFAAQIGPERLPVLIDHLFNSSEFFQWEVFLRARVILNLSDSGIQLDPAPTEVDRASVRLVQNFLAHQLTPEDYSLMLEYYALGSARDLHGFLQRISTPESLMDLIAKTRVHYGDIEMAKNIHRFGGERNILLVGSAHTLDDWRDQFNIFRLNVIGDVNDNTRVRLSGCLPEDLSRAVRDFDHSSIPDIVVNSDSIQSI